MNEIITDVPGYEEIYKCSSLGRIIAYPRVQKTNIRHNTECIRKEMELRPHLTRFGYHRICLYKDGQGRKMHVHQVVAKTFVPGYFEGAFVNHIDGNKLNNIPSNLEWVTPSRNIQHAFDIGLHVINEKTKKAVSERHSGGRNVNAKKVIDTKNGKIYECINDAAKDLNISVWNLYAYLKGRNTNTTSLKYA